MSGEELTLVRDTQAEISRRLKIQDLEQLEHSQAVERAWILTLLKSLEELELVAQIRQQIEKFEL